MKIDENEIPSELLAFKPLYNAERRRIDKHFARRKALFLRTWILRENRRTGLLELAVRPYSWKYWKEIFAANFKSFAKITLFFLLLINTPLILYWLFRVGYWGWQFFEGKSVYVEEYLLPDFDQVLPKNKVTVGILVYEIFPLMLWGFIVLLCFIDYFISLKSKLTSFWNGGIGFSLDRNRQEIFFYREQKRYRRYSEKVSENEKYSDIERSAGSVVDSGVADSDDKEKRRSSQESVNSSERGPDHEAGRKNTARDPEAIQRIVLAVLSGQSQQSSRNSGAGRIMFSSQLAVLIQTKSGEWIRHDLLEAGESEFFDRETVRLSEELRCPIVRKETKTPFVMTRDYLESQFYSAKIRADEKDLERAVLLYYDKNKKYDCPQIMKMINSPPFEPWGGFMEFFKWYVSFLFILAVGAGMICIIVFSIFGVCRIFQLKKKYDNYYLCLQDLLGMPLKELKKNDQILTTNFVLYLLQQNGYKAIYKNKKVQLMPDPGQDDRRSTGE